MITRTIDEGTVSVIPEEADDLLTLRRVIKAEDRIGGSTTRVLKQERDFARPDRGERIRIRIALNVEKVSLDNVLDRLRVGGTIIESNNESVSHGSHHSLLIQIGEGITIRKKKWSPVEKRLINTNSERSGFVLVAIDISDCGIARLRGTHLQIMPNLYSGSSGKRYKTSFKIEGFFGEVIKAISSVIEGGDSMIIFGPGETRKKFGNYLQKTPVGQKHAFQIVEGIDSGGEDGIYTFTRSEIMREAMAESKMARVASIIDQVMAMANKKSRKFSMGYEETKKANEFGAIDSLVFSDIIIQQVEEQKVMDFLNDAESRGAKSFSVDSTTDVGLRVSGLGGIIALLRFPVGA